MPGAIREDSSLQCLPGVPAAGSQDTHCPEDTAVARAEIEEIHQVPAL